MPRDDFNFEYRGRTAESVERRKSKMAAGSFDKIFKSDIPTFKPKEGENHIRILPPTWNTDPDSEEGARWGDGWEIQIHLHYGVGPDRGSYLCLDKMLGKPCSVCDARHDMDEDEKNEIRVSARNVCWIVDRKNEKLGPQVWSMPGSVAKDIANRSKSRDGNPLPIDSPQDGYDVTFNKEGTDIKTKYTSIDVDREPSYLNQDEAIEKKWLQYIVDNPLPEVLEYYESDYIEKVLFGAGKSEGGGRSERAPRERAPAEEPRGGGRRLASEESAGDPPAERAPRGRATASEEPPFEGGRRVAGTRAGETSEPEAGAAPAERAPRGRVREAAEAAPAERTRERAPAREERAPREEPRGSDDAKGRLSSLRRSVK